MHPRLADLIIAVISFALFATQARAGDEPASIKITSPTEQQVYRTGANCSVTGLLEFAGNQADLEMLFVRVRLYRAGNNVFVIESEALTQPKKPALRQKQYRFEANVKAPPKDGPYLLKVDCLVFGPLDYPKNLLATQSLFVKLASDKRSNAPGHKTLYIKTPNAGDTFGTGATITVDRATLVNR